MRQSERLMRRSQNTTIDNKVEPLVGLLDYLRPEIEAIDPTAEYFIRMARASLVEADQAANGERNAN
jgi:hypothetical protein